MNENVTHPVPCPQVLTDSLTHAYAKCENRHLCFINDHFSKTKTFCFITKTHFIYQIPCFYTFVGQGFRVSYRRTPHAFSSFLWAFTIGDHVQPQLIDILPFLTFLRVFTTSDHVQHQLIDILPFLTFLRIFPF